MTVGNSFAGQILHKWRTRDFLQRGVDAFAPLRSWVAMRHCVSPLKCSATFGISVLSAVWSPIPIRSRWRMNYSSIPIAARRLREENFRVILDEAQDTDPGAIFCPDGNHTAAGCDWPMAGNRNRTAADQVISAWSAISSNRFIEIVPT